MNDMYSQQKVAAGSQSISGYVDNIHNPTIRENIDARIAMAEAAVARLKATKQQMEKTGILDLKIGDLREAMKY